MKGNLSKKERKIIALEKQRQRSREANLMHEFGKENFSDLKKSNIKKRTLMLLALGFVLLLLFSFGAYAYLSPGKYDDFAKCLSDKGVVMYGEDWCKYTNGQKNMFGKSFKYINYEVKTGLNYRPTWVINGKSYEKVQSFERLSELSGCKY